jgi:hypothetical protein
MFVVTGTLLLWTMSIAIAPARTPQHEPHISAVRTKGKKLLVTGENFARGAVVVLNGQRQKTRAEDEAAGTLLVAPKAGKKIEPGELASVQVVNPDGSQSNAELVFAGREITLDDSGKIIELKVGERVLVFLKKDSYQFTLDVSDPGRFAKIPDASIPAGAQGVFEARAAGSVLLSAVGELPCHRSNPPCLAPSLGFEVRLLVE